MIYHETKAKVNKTSLKNDHKVIFKIKN